MSLMTALLTNISGSGTDDAESPPTERLPVSGNDISAMQTGRKNTTIPEKRSMRSTQEYVMIPTGTFNRFIVFPVMRIFFPE